MTKSSNRIMETRIFARRNWMFEIKPYSMLPIKTFDEVNDDLRLRRVLKRAVMQERAPQSLFDSIKSGIKK